MEGLVLGIYLLVWLGMGVWASTVMKRKNRSGGLGWALGLIGGVFGVLVAYVLDEKEADHA